MTISFSSLLPTLRSRLAAVRTRVLRRTPGIEDLQSDLNRLVARSAMAKEAANARANELEQQVAALNDEIDRLDLFVDEAQLIENGARRMLGEA